MNETKRDVNKPDDHEDDGFDDLEGVRGRRGGGTVTKAFPGGGSPEAILARYLNTGPKNANPFFQDKPKPSRRFKKAIKKARLHDDHHEFRKLPDIGQDQQLARWLEIAYGQLWPLAVKVKRRFDRDPVQARLAMGFPPPKNPHFLMTSGELQRWFTKQRRADPELAELPRDVADQLLDNVVAAFITFHQSDKTNLKQLDNPVRTLRFKYVHFITREADYARDKSLRKYITTRGDADDLQVNDRAVHIPKLGNVSFTADSDSRMFLRTANLRIMSAVMRLHEDGEWRIRPHFKRLRGRLIHKNVIIREILQSFPEQEVEQRITKAGYHIRKHELNKWKREATLTHPDNVLDEVAKLASYKVFRGATFISTTEILADLHQHGIKIDLNYLQECLSQYDVERHRGRTKGHKQRGYLVNSILLANARI